MMMGIGLSHFHFRTILNDGKHKKKDLFNYNTEKGLFHHFSYSRKISFDSLNI